MVKDAVLKVYPSAPYDLAVTHRDELNADHQIKRTAREWLATPQATRRALVQDLLETLQASSSSFDNCTEPSSA